MNLKCGQFDVDLRAIDGFFIAGRFNDGNIVAVSKAAIDQIPMVDRRNQMCEDVVRGGDYLGIDIYYGRGVEDGEFYSNRSMTQGKFAFSVSREVMYRHLTNLISDFPERFPSKRKIA